MIFLFSVKNDSLLAEEESRKYWFLVYSFIYEIKFALFAPGHLHEIQRTCSLCKMFLKKKISIYFQDFKSHTKYGFSFFCLKYWMNGETRTIFLTRFLYL